MEFIIDWVQKNIGHTFSSTRGKRFGTRTLEFEFVSIDNQKISIRFEGSNYIALPLKFWMFKRAMDHLNKNGGNFVPIGARIRPPYMPNSVEEAIWKEPLPEKISAYKAAPHICDVLELTSLVEFGKAYNPSSRRNVQGVKIIQ